ncbi:protein TRANSPORT INHIBITOR RESPONSE 1-like [Hibiscus syriacus]|uniref:protein TRANSPORT INHIBITOR RESPONSE 1-like n=1 Tax=Hibiscus syriacus TaxID=106335 RepID=UPI001920CE4E|nr:protein TRANSPORT INHIBITOR RESPONSE 1-like [Hibiscus syriacus]
MELPEECWESIFSFLEHHRYSEPLSLVCKRFLSITSHLRRTLTITDPTLESLPNILLRFPNLTTIVFRDFHVVDISYPDHGCGFSPNGSLDSKSVSGLLTDYGILRLASSLKSLRKIDLSGNTFITDQALVTLSSNCLFLTEIGIRDCDFITQNGIALALRKSDNLKSIFINGIGIPSIDACFLDSFAYARSLSELDLSNSFISDELLCLVAEANLPLHKLVSLVAFVSHLMGFVFSCPSIRLLHTWILKEQISG